MYKAAVIPGDGIGPEVTEEALDTLRTIADIHDLEFEFVHYPFGAENYLDSKELLPDHALKEMEEMDAIFLGAIGDDRVEPGVLERGIVGKLRMELDLYVNLRPIKLYAGHISPLSEVEVEELDVLVVRENTEGLYAGSASRCKSNTDEEVMFQPAMYSRKGTEQIISYAFERAQERGGNLTLVDKCNAIEAHQMYREVLEELSDQYPDVNTECSYVDAVSMWFVKNPDYYDTIVTTNMFGDILTDLGAMLQGGLGIAAGANIRPGELGMFEPIHGSAPRHQGKNVVSPIAAIMAVKMMLEFFEEKQAARDIEEAISHLLSSGELPSLSTDSKFSTKQIGEMVREKLQGRTKGK